MDTEPLPAVGASGPGPVQPRYAHGWWRVLEVTAGVLSGGLVVIGLALVVLQFLAPDIAPGTGLTAARGPGWGRAFAQLGVGICGEIVVWLRPRLPRSARVSLAALIVVLSAAVLWFCWWA